MATFYKYAEREADSYVNWGKIGQDLSNMLSEQQKIREDKRAAIDKASREFGETLSNAPQGEQKQLNQWALEYASDAQQARLLQDRLLKSGQLSVKDYTVMRQNINDGTKQAFNLVKEYQEKYKEKMERLKQDKSQDLEGWLWEQAQNFGDFTKNKLYINPTNFQVSVAGTKKQVVDGKEVYVMDTDPNKYTTVNALRNRMSGTYDKYDLPNNVKAMVDNLGVEIKSLEERAGNYTRTGLVSEILDITKRTNLPADAQGIVMKFEEAETKMLQAQLQNPYNTSSILTNTIGTAPNGKQYTFTFSEEERNKNPNMILLKDSETGNPTPVFTPEQEKAALERLRLEARMQYDRKQEYKVTSQIQRQDEPEWKFRAREDAKKAEDAAGAWNQLYTGKTAAEKKAAAEILLGTPKAQQLGLIDIDLESQPGKVLLKYTDSRLDRPIDMVDASGKPISLRDFSSKGVELHGVEDRDKAMRAGGGSGTYVGLTDYKGVRASRKGEAPKQKPINVPLSAVTEESAAASKTLQDALPSGFVVKDTGGFTGNTIEVTAPNGKIYKYTSKKKGPSADSFKKDLEAFVEANRGETEL